MANNNQFKIIAFLIASLIFLLMQPYFMWQSALPIDFVKYAFYFVVLTQVEWRGNNLILFLFLLFTIAIIPISHGNNILGILMYSLVAVIPFLKRNVLKETYSYFYNIYVIIISISMLVWILVILGVPMPNRIISPLNDLKQYNYLVYPLLTMSLDISQGAAIFAFSGPFDERGVVGTISLILLYIGNLDLRNKKNILLLISGLISLSLFFYVGLIAFYFMKLITYKETKNSKIGIVIFAAVVLFCIMEVPFLYDTIGSRLVYDSAEGRFVGNNRNISVLNEYIESIRFSQEYFFGSSADIVESFAGQASIYMAVLNYGALFILLYFIFYIIYARREFGSFNINLLSALIVLLCVLYQRPGFIKVEYLFLFTCCIIYYIFRSIPVQDSGAVVSSQKGQNDLFLMSIRP